MNNKTDNKKNDTLSLLKNLLSSRISMTVHREIAAWTITVFYVTIIIAVVKFLDDNQYLNNPCTIIIAMITTIFLCFIVFSFIHAQYGAHVSLRSQYMICVKKMFELLNDDIVLTKENCTVTSPNVYPNFIQDEINQNTDDIHSISKINPFVIYSWFYKRLKLSFYIKKGKKIEIRISIIEKLKKISKIQLIESAIYNLLLLPSLVVLGYYIYLLITV